MDIDPKFRGAVSKYRRFDECKDDAERATLQVFLNVCKAKLLSTIHHINCSTLNVLEIGNIVRMLPQEYNASGGDIEYLEHIIQRHRANRNNTELTSSNDTEVSMTIGTIDTICHSLDGVVRDIDLAWRLCRISNIDDMNAALDAARNVIRKNIGQLKEVASTKMDTNNVPFSVIIEECNLMVSHISNLRKLHSSMIQESIADHLQTAEIISKRLASFLIGAIKTLAADDFKINPCSSCGAIGTLVMIRNSTGTGWVRCPCGRISGEVELKLGRYGIIAQWNREHPINGNLNA